MRPRVTVVGLGPAGADLVTPLARAHLAGADRPFVRTRHHPAVTELEADGLTFRTFDHCYEQADRIEDVYRAIVGELVRAAEDDGDTVYGVPGSPAVAERSVELLRSTPVELEVVAGLSFVDLAWTRLGVDPAEGATVADGHSFSIAAAGRAGSLLIGQCDSAAVLSQVKIALLDVLDPADPVTVLARLGSPDEAVFDVPCAELDRAVDPDPRTSLFVDTGTRPLAPELARFVELMERLRGPGGCPWDAEQTHHSLARYVLEEAYEVVEAVEALPVDAPSGNVPPAAYAALGDELGDLLCQVVFHATLASEAGAFTMADVVAGIHDKLVRRHPHVFSDVDVEGSSDVMRNWERIKRAERGTSSLVAGVSPTLPSLLYAHKLQRKAASIGLDPGEGAAAMVQLRAAVESLDAAVGVASFERALGDLLAAAVVAARAHGVDAESTLRGWAARFRARFERAEALARERGEDLADLDAAGVADRFSEAGR